MLVISVVSLVDYMCFGRNLGTLSSSLTFAEDPSFSHKEVFLNTACAVACSVFLFLAYKQKRIKKNIPFAYMILIFCTCVLSAINIYHIQQKLSDMAYIKDTKEYDGQALFSLSRKGKNVIVLMLDRAISGYVPYLFEEKPELREQFTGFSYYPNALSYGFYTSLASPALYGGYDYTVTEMDRRSEEKLVDKHNEALKVMPLMFLNEGFSVTVCDPTYANYHLIPDLSIYDEYEGIHACITMGSIKDPALQQYMRASGLRNNERNFFCYAVFKVMPLCFSRAVYDGGKYFTSKQSDIDEDFAQSYSVLSQLPELTAISDDDRDTFLMMSNDITHEPCLLQLPAYEPVETVNNEGYESPVEKYIHLDTKLQISHYHVNMAAFLQLGKWFAFMKENGVYDNTRIILVSDHGRGLGQFDYMLMAEPPIDVQWCNPLLMMKDFYAETFSTIDDFMTNADVPSLAVKDIIANPLNPFTGNPIIDEKRKMQPQIISLSHNFGIERNNGYTFDTSDGHWYSVHDDIFREENWKQLD